MKCAKESNDLTSPGNEMCEFDRRLNGYRSRIAKVPFTQYASRSGRNHTGQILADARTSHGHQAHRGNADWEFYVRAMNDDSQSEPDRGTALDRAIVH